VNVGLYETGKQAAQLFLAGSYTAAQKRTQKPQQKRQRATHAHCLLFTLFETPYFATN